MIRLTGRTTRWRRVTALLLGAGLVGVLLTLNLPHRHPDGSSSTDPNHSCPITKINQSFSPSLPRVPVLVPYQVAAAACPRFIHQSPRRLCICDSSAPRAPPTLS